MTENKLTQNAWRPPNWRSRRTLRTLDGRRRPANRRDGTVSATRVAEYRNFLLAYRQCEQSPRWLHWLARENPAMYRAHALYHDPSKRRSRFAVEARLLAGQKNQEIAGSLNCAPKIIKTYAALFFDVRPRLAHADYINQVVLGESVSGGRGEPDYAQLWKRVAYHYGPHVLGAMLSGFANPQRADRAEDVSASLRELARNSLSRKAAWATLAVPINSSTHWKLIDASRRSVVAQQKAEADPKDNPILANIDAMLTSLPFGVGTKPEDLAQQGPLMQYDGLAAELRTDELLLAAAGFELPNHDEIVNLKFPSEAVSPEAVSPMQ